MESSESTDWKGIDVVDADGARIGTVVEMYLDTETGEPEWVAVSLVSTDGPGTFDRPDTTARFVPLSGTSFGETALIAQWSVETIAGSPVEVSDHGITRVEEDELYRYYGLEYPTQWVNSGVPGGAEMVGVAGIAAEADESSIPGPPIPEDQAPSSCD
jgi:sporulation protein YlmC with PRC-barrel domain